MITKRHQTRYTPWQELMRFGLRKAFIQTWMLVSAGCGAGVAYLLPLEHPDVFRVLVYTHLMLFAAVFLAFAFWVGGEKGDFHPAVLWNDSNDRGFTALRDAVLHLFWPIILHGAALGLAIVRVMLEAGTSWPAVAAVWSWVYAPISVWSFIQTYFCLRMLYCMAIIRLVCMRNAIKGIEAEEAEEAEETVKAERTRCKQEKPTDSRGSTPRAEGTEGRPARRVAAELPATHE